MLRILKILKGIQEIYGSKGTQDDDDDDEDEEDDENVHNRNGNVPNGGFNQPSAHGFVPNGGFYQPSVNRFPFGGSPLLPPIPYGYEEKDCAYSRIENNGVRVNCKKGWTSGSSSPPAGSHVIPFEGSGFTLPNGYGVNDCVVTQKGNSRHISCGKSF